MQGVSIRPLVITHIKKSLMCGMRLSLHLKEGLVGGTLIGAYVSEHGVQLGPPKPARRAMR